METNSLRFTTEKVRKGIVWIIKVSLDDQCKNGHQDFAITADRYIAGKPRIDRYCEGGGACGDEVSKYWPEFTIFNDLHLCDYLGRPMYAAENGRYHLRTNFEVGRDYLFLTQEEAESLLPYVEDKDAFAYKLESLSVLDRWKAKADEAIAILEQWTENKFIVDSKRSQYEPLSEERKAELKVLFEDGYYSVEEMNKRKQARIDEENQKLLKKTRDSFNKRIALLKLEMSVFEAIVEAGLNTKNFIFYSHSMEFRFNWKSYEVGITREQFDNFVANHDFPGVTFAFGERDNK